MRAALCQQGTILSQNYPALSLAQWQNQITWGPHGKLQRQLCLTPFFWLEKLRHKVPTLCPNSKEILEAMVLTQPIKYSSGLFQDTPYKKNSFGALLHLNTS